MHEARSGALTSTTPNKKTIAQKTPHVFTFIVVQCTVEYITFIYRYRKIWTFFLSRFSSPFLCFPISLFLILILHHRIQLVAATSAYVSFQSIFTSTQNVHVRDIHETMESKAKVIIEFDMRKSNLSFRPAIRNRQMKIKTKSVAYFVL